MHKKTTYFSKETSSQTSLPKIGKNKKRISYLSPINPQDKSLLQKIVLKNKPHSINYEDSWGYIIQATRYDGFKWYDAATNSLLFFGEKSEDDPTLIIPNFFAEPSYLVNVLTILKHSLNPPKIILKNVYSQDVVKLLPFGFRPYTNDERWSSFARFDDQTYPQLVVDLTKLKEKKGKRYKKLRNYLNHEQNTSIRKYQASDSDSVLSLFIAKDGNTKGMYYTSHKMYLTSDTAKFVITNTETNEIIGFTATSAITPENCALVVALFKPGIKYASVWGIYNTLIARYNEGFRYINLGGYETEGTYNFMRRTFQPVEKLERTHLVYTA
jgi:hypothetical protein